MANKASIFRLADVEVSEREFSLTKAGERLAVEPKAFRVLLILLRNPRKLIPKQELLDAVWAPPSPRTRGRAPSLSFAGSSATKPDVITTMGIGTWLPIREQVPTENQYGCRPCGKGAKGPPGEPSDYGWG